MLLAWVILVGQLQGLRSAFGDTEQLQNLSSNLLQIEDLRRSLPDAIKEVQRQNQADPDANPEEVCKTGNTKFIRTVTRSS